MQRSRQCCFAPATQRRRRKWVKGGRGRAVLGPSQVPLITAEIVSPVAWFVTLRAPCLPLRKLRQTGGIQMLATVASSSFDTTKRRPSASNRTPPSFSTSSSIVFLVTERTRNPSLAANVKPPALPIHHLTLWHAYAFMRQHSLFVTLRPHASSLPRSDRICGAPAFGSYQ